MECLETFISLFSNFTWMIHMCHNINTFFFCLMFSNHIKSFLKIIHNNAATERKVRADEENSYTVNITESYKNHTYTSYSYNIYRCHDKQNVINVTKITSVFKPSINNNHCFIYI